MVQITRSLIVLASFATSCMSAATVSNIVSDIQDMIQTGQHLENSFNGVNTYNWMITSPPLHTGVLTLVSGIDQCSRDIVALPRPVSDGDASAIFSAITPLGSLSQQFMMTLVSAKPRLVKLPIAGSVVGPIVAIELSSIQRSIANFQTVMETMIPTSLASNTSALKNTINNNLASAIQAYSTN